MLYHAVGNKAKENVENIGTFTGTPILCTTSNCMTMHILWHGVKWLKCVCKENISNIWDVPWYISRNLCEVLG